MRRSQRRTPQPPRLTGDNSAVAFHQTRLGELAGSIELGRSKQFLRGTLSTLRRERFVEPLSQASLKAWT